MLRKDALGRTDWSDECHVACPLSSPPRVKLKHFSYQEIGINCVVYNKRKDFSTASTGEKGLNDRLRLFHQVSNL